MVCGSDNELLIAKFRLKLKNIGKTTWPFRYDLSQIPYDYTVEVTNRFKGLHLIEFLKDYGWRFVIKEQQLELDMEQCTGSKLGKEYVKAVYCHSAYLTYMHSTSCEMSSWRHWSQEAVIKTIPRKRNAKGQKG